jgi:hypothetical protein
MNLGIITYISPNKSHGYLLKLDRLEKSYVYETAKRKDKSQSSLNPH